MLSVGKYVELTAKIFSIFKKVTELQILYILYIIQQTNQPRMAFPTNRRVMGKISDILTDHFKTKYAIFEIQCSNDLTASLETYYIL